MTFSYSIDRKLVVDHLENSIPENWDFCFSEQKKIKIWSEKDFVFLDMVLINKELYLFIIHKDIHHRHININEFEKILEMVSKIL